MRVKYVQLNGLYRISRVMDTAEHFSPTIPGGIGGLDILKKLLELDPQVKAIACSGYSTDMVMANYRDHGFSGILSKPFRLEDFSKILQELLSP